MTKVAKISDKNLILSIVMVTAIVAIGLVAYVKFAPADSVPKETVIKEETEPGGGVRLMTPYYKDNELAFRSESVEVPPGIDKYVFAINRYLRSVEAVPKEANLIACVIKDGTATLNFNTSFRTSYGTDDESTLINGVLAVMGQFEDVNFVKFTVEGKNLESLGNLDLIDPQSVLRLPVPAAKQVTPAPAKS